MRLYKFMKDHRDFKYVLLEEYDVSSNDEKLKWEQHWYDQLQPNLNMCRCHNTDEDNKNFRRIRDKTETGKKVKDKYSKTYRLKHPDRLKIRNKEYRDRVKHIVMCHCGHRLDILRSDSREVHYKSNRHKSYKTLIENFKL